MQTGRAGYHFGDGPLAVCRRHLQYSICQVTQEILFVLTTNVGLVWDFSAAASILHVTVVYHSMNLVTSESHRSGSDVDLSESCLQFTCTATAIAPCVMMCAVLGVDLLHMHCFCIRFARGLVLLKWDIPDLYRSQDLIHMICYKEILFCSFVIVIYGLSLKP